MSREAHIVVDLGFGDCGKGTLTDHLVRHSGARLVVRFNGGAQAGHTVVLPDGRQHTFSQFGAASFVPDVRTHLSRHMLVHPGGLLQEAAVLEGKGVSDVLSRLSIDPRALIISPFQQSANRLREVLRGEGRHGSCGLGIGETAQDALEFPNDAIRAGDLANPERLRPRLLRQQQRKWKEFSSSRDALLRNKQAIPEMCVLESPDLAERWIFQAGELAARVRIAEIELPDKLVLEGAQGVLLDEWRGFHPYTTWSTCTFDNALEVLQGWNGEVTRWGVLRSYSTRHGAGPFPTEEPGLALPEPHNATGPWQGGFRQGWLDLVLARYAVECCGGVDRLAITHLDRVEGDWQVCTVYDGVPFPYYDGGLATGPFQDLEYQEELGKLVLGAVPRYRSVADARALLTLIEDQLGAPIGVASWGPGPEHKRIAQQEFLPGSRLARA